MSVRCRAGRGARRKRLIKTRTRAPGVCGIAGILGREDKPVVQAMMDRIAHRGPDGEGCWTDDGVTLGHRRLAIIDVATGDQPMESHDGRFCVVYNGEVYNHVALRRRLEAEGATFRTDHSDTEVLLEAYRAWGPDMVQHVEGMFAFALWDTLERTLFVARDPFGIKPFFYACVGGDFVFASEQKALLAHPAVRPVADLDRIKERAALEFLTGQATLFQGVHQLPPGTWAVLRPDAPGECHVDWQPYYTVGAERYPTIEDAAHTIKDRFVASVEEQLMSDVPLGVILSGGLDSAAVAAVHQSLSPEPIHTFTVAESEDVEDFRQARRLADELGTDHHECFFDLDDVIAQMPRYTYHNENINYTEFFFHPLFERMAQDVKVGLCGQGSDELWGGYDRYKDPLPLARDRIARIRAAAPRHGEELATQVAMTHVSGSSLAEFDQLGGQLNNFQLRLVDRNSMTHSLEVRVPFLSKPLHRVSRAVTWGWKLRDDVEKWILRKGLEEIGLPHDLLWRPKVPAGRATSPGVMDRFEAYAAKLVPKQAMRDHPLRGTFGAPAEQLLYELWNAVFVEQGGDPKGLTLEDLA